MKYTPHPENLNDANECQDVRSSSRHVVDLQHSVHQVFQQVIEGSLELATSQTRQWEQSQELAMQLQEYLRSVKDRDIQAMFDVFGNINNQLVSLTAFNRSRKCSLQS